MSVDPKVARALDRLLKKMERRSRPRPRRFSTAPITLALGLALAYQLLARLVPALWSATLPGGLEQARSFDGLAGLVWRLSVACRTQFEAVALGLGVVALGGLVVSQAARPLRLLVWLAGAGMILVDAGILVVALAAAMRAGASAAGLS